MKKAICYLVTTITIIAMTVLGSCMINPNDYAGKRVDLEKVRAIVHITDKVEKITPTPNLTTPSPTPTVVVEEESAPEPTPEKTFALPDYSEAELNGGNDSEADEAVITEPPSDKRASDLPKETPPAEKEVNMNNSIPASKASLKGLVIGIDPGHQSKADSKTEPEAPDSKTMKKRTSSGTQGIKSKTPEYKINLIIGLALKKELEARGAKVVMTREKNDVKISNAERAILLNKAKVDFAIRLHCDGNTDADKHGTSVLIPSGKYCKAIDSSSKKIGKIMLDEFTEATGSKSNGLSSRSDQTGFNWSKVPICNVEMGFMTNVKEDALLNDADYQKKCVNGLINGITKVFENYYN